jgi:hypothetical protein
MTIGIVLVACLAVLVAGTVVVTITSTLIWMSSAMSMGS